MIRRPDPRPVLLLLPLLLAGCFPRPDYSDLPNANVIRLSTWTATVKVRDPDHPSPEERTALAGYRAASGPTDTRFRVLLPTGTAVPDDTEGRALALGLGLPPAATAVLPHAQPGPDTLVEIVHVEALAPDCAQLVTPNEVIGADERPSIALGCATYSNLAAQVADPADLLQPAAFAGAAATPTSTAIDNYLADKVKTPPNISLSKVGSTSSSGSSGGGSTQ